MRILPLLAAVWSLSVWSVWAQLSVEIVLDQEQYLRDEPLLVKVRITNRSGQTLQMGENDEWLNLVVESLEPPPGAVARIAPAPVRGEFTLDSAQIATRQVDLTPYYDISQAGRYQVSASVRVKEWNEEISSKPRQFEVVRGSKLWQLDFGVPSTNGGPPEPRRYTLQQANYRKQLKLYLRLTDLSDQRVFRVFQMGPLVSFSQTEAQVDKSSYLHVLFQVGARTFLFCVVSPDGDLVVRQTYDYTATRPTLKPAIDGRIFVGGGARHIAATDIPAPFFESSSNTVAGASLTDTNANGSTNGITSTNSVTATTNSVANTNVSDRVSPRRR